MSGHRSYRHTMWRGEGNASRRSVGWYVRLDMKKRGHISRQEVCPFCKETDAAAYLAKARGIAVSALRIRAPVAAAKAAETLKVSMYKYVVYHKRKGGWVVQVTPSVQRKEVSGRRSRKRKHAHVVNV